MKPIPRYPSFRQAWLQRIFSLLALAAASAHADGLGGIKLLSAQGEPLHVSIVLPAMQQEAIDGACLSAKVASLDGVLLAMPQVTVTRDEMALKSMHAMSEPHAVFTVQFGCHVTQRSRYHVMLPTRPSLRESAPRLRQSASLSEPVHDRFEDPESTAAGTRRGMGRAQQ